MSQTTRIVAHLGVLDEVDLIRRSVEHLRIIGVDHIIVCDMGSSDGTLDVLEPLAGDNLELICMQNSDSWDTWLRTTMHWIRSIRSDWVLFLDADEFWLPAAGSLREFVDRQTADIVSVPRFNVVLDEPGPMLPESLLPSSYEDILLYCSQRDDFREHLEATPETSWISGVPMAKIIARSSCVESVTMGTHDIVASRPTSPVVTSDLIIAHLPISTLRRFERRVENIRRFLAYDDNYFQGHQGWHWRRWARLAEQGRIVEEFQRQTVGDLGAERKAGRIRSAAELLGLCTPA